MAKWLRALGIAVAVPGLVLAQTAISVENTGSVERPLSEGQVLPEVHSVHTILWTDDGGSDESYNVYVSDAPITDVAAANVFRVGTEIAEGQQAFEYALLTPFSPGAVANYYAVTLVSSGGVENATVAAGTNATTGATDGTTDWAQPIFWFIDAPFIDGDFSDWPFAPVDMDPDNPDNFFGGEITGPSDFTYSAAMGIDADNLYVRAEATDDLFVNTAETGTGDIWQGDAAEWYVGTYHLGPSDSRHAGTQYGSEGSPEAAQPDLQVVVAANAFDDGERTHLFGPANADGLNGTLGSFGAEIQTIETATGWAIEASVSLEGIAQDPAIILPYQPKIGHILPTTFAGNDGDDPAGGRQGQLFWSKDESVNNAWNTPSSWQREQVIYDPKVFGLGGGGTTAVKSSSWGEIKAGAIR